LDIIYATYYITPGGIDVHIGAHKEADLEQKLCRQEEWGKWVSMEGHAIDLSVSLVGHPD